VPLEEGGERGRTRGEGNVNHRTSGESLQEYAQTQRTRSFGSPKGKGSPQGWGGGA